MNFSVKAIYIHKAVSQLSGGKIQKNPNPQNNPATKRKLEKKVN